MLLGEGYYSRGKVSSILHRGNRLKTLEKEPDCIIYFIKLFFFLDNGWELFPWLSKFFLTICIQKPVCASSAYMKCNIKKQSLRKSCILLCWKSCSLMLQVSPTRQMGIYTGFEDTSLQNKIECHIPTNWLILAHSKEMTNC